MAAETDGDLGTEQRRTRHGGPQSWVDDDSVDGQTRPRPRRRDEVEEVDLEAGGRRRDGVRGQVLLGGWHQHLERVGGHQVEVSAVGVLDHQSGMRGLDQRWLGEHGLVELPDSDCGDHHTADRHRRRRLRGDHTDRVAEQTGCQRHRDEPVAEQVGRGHLLGDVVAEGVTIRDVGALIAAEHGNGMIGSDSRSGQVGSLDLDDVTDIEMEHLGAARVGGGAEQVTHRREVDRGVVVRRHDRNLARHRPGISSHEVVGAQHVERQPEEGVCGELDPVEPVDGHLVVGDDVDGQRLVGAEDARCLHHRLGRQHDRGHSAGNHRERCRKTDSRHIDRARSGGLTGDEQGEFRRPDVVRLEGEPVLAALRVATSDEWADAHCTRGRRRSPAPV